MITPIENGSQNLKTLKDLRHALKNDVSVIIAFAQLLKVSTSDKKSLEHLEKIESRAKSILTNIEAHLTHEKS